MVKLINKDFGNEMWVAEERLEEYKAAGHKLAAEPPAPTPEAKPKRKATTTKRKRGA